MKIRACGHTDCGIEREINQDAYFIDDELGLYIVCDGMGGHAAGEVASKTVVDIIAEHIRHYKKDIPDNDDSEKTYTALTSLVQNAVSTACQKLIQLVDENQDYAGMGTTMTMLMVHGSKGIIGHVGDSKLLLHRREKFNQLTRDHTLANRLLSEGVITLDQVADSPVAHVLTRALGKVESVAVDTLVFDLVPGDLCIIASDGFTNAFNNTREIESLIPLENLPELGQQEFSELVSKLVEQAVSRDGTDNTTAIVVSFEEEEEESVDELRRSQDVYLKIDTLKQVFLFDDLSLQEILTVMENVKVLDCTAGTTVVHEGQEGDSLYVILSGEFTVEHQGSQLVKLGQGSHFGEMALVSQAVRSATVTATQTARLLVMKKSSFDKLVLQHKEIGISLLWKLAVELSLRLARSNEDRSSSTI